jgi:hypothetical protein
MTIGWMDTAIREDEKKERINVICCLLLLFFLCPFLYSRQNNWPIENSGNGRTGKKSFYCHRATSFCSLIGKKQTYGHQTNTSLQI